MSPRPLPKALRPLDEDLAAGRQRAEALPPLGYRQVYDALKLLSGRHRVAVPVAAVVKHLGRGEATVRGYCDWFVESGLATYAPGDLVAIK